MLPLTCTLTPTLVGPRHPAAAAEGYLAASGMLPSPALPAAAVPPPAAVAAPPQAAAQPQPSSVAQPQDSGAAAELDRRAAELERKAAELEAARREAASAREAVAHEVAIMRRQLDTAQAAAAEAEKVGGRDVWLCPEAARCGLLWPRRLPVAWRWTLSAPAALFSARFITGTPLSIH